MSNNWTNYSLLIRAANRINYSLKSIYLSSRQKRSICVFLLHDEPPMYDDRLELTFFHGNRVYFFFSLPMVETFFSWRYINKIFKFLKQDCKGNELIFISQLFFKSFCFYMIDYE